jgi:methylase of polypeptide subunit release factors
LNLLIQDASQAAAAADPDVAPLLPRAADEAPCRPDLDTRDQALRALGSELRERGYRFVTPTPLTHRRVNERVRNRTAPTLQAVFGWSRPCRALDLPSRLVSLLAEAGELEASGERLRSRVRFSTLADQLFVHSAFPTDQPDAVFFGPDTYRFARVIRQSLHDRPAPPRKIIDLGCGSGAGGLLAASLLAGTGPQIVLTDINPRALRFSRVNAALNGIPNVETREGDLFAGTLGTFDLIVANPPYLVDPGERLYRHGGGELGFALSLRIVAEGIERLAPGGRLVLYTGTAIVDGTDRFLEALTGAIADRGFSFIYEEIDPDVFGEELEHPPYDRADRIAVVALTIDAHR